MLWERGSHRDLTAAAGADELCLCRAIITANERGRRMSMSDNSTMDLKMGGRDAETRVDSRTAPSSLRPNLFSGD
jgi:hypothetical protein